MTYLASFENENILRESIFNIKLTCDTWHVTCHTWHLTCKMWQVMGVNIPSKCQLPSSYSLGKKVFSRLGGNGWLRQLINYTGFYRTAQATPGLLISKVKIQYHLTFCIWACPSVHPDLGATMDSLCSFAK